MTSYTLNCGWELCPDLQEPLFVISAASPRHRDEPADLKPENRVLTRSVTPDCNRERDPLRLQSDLQTCTPPGAGHLQPPRCESPELWIQMESPFSHHINNRTGRSLPAPELQVPPSGFGTPWSVQTSPPPPPGPMTQLPDSDSEFYPGPPPLSTAFFPGFPPVSPCRRAPGSPVMSPQQGAFLQQKNHYNQHQPVMKQSPWGSHQGNGWGLGGTSWGRDHRRGGGSGTHASPLKKPFTTTIIAPPKYPRSAGPKLWMEENLYHTDGNSNTLMPRQERSRMYDSLNMHSLESSLIDIMRAEQDPLKGRSSLFPLDHHLEDIQGNAPHHGFPMQNGPHGFPMQNGPHGFPMQNGTERFSRKVFVGGLPPDIDEDEITSSFRRFGLLVVDWPHKAESKSYFPPKGYAFLLFQEESSVQALIEACMEDDGKLYLCVSSPTIKDKPVQIRPWNLGDSDFVMDGSQPLDPRKTIFVGGVPRPLRAIELAMIMDRLYGGVCYAGIDTDPELKYPKGAGRVAFSNQQSYIAAISARFVQLQHGDIDKRVEVKPYVLDDQLCDECQGARCGGKFAPFFCANVTCLQYYCEFCWANIHSRAGREFHKPLVKEGADRPRHVHFRWN
ncbi:hypothetical protein PBY51_025064 [Eleginops maclovinus]|uniref:RRM domain-containing protein n=1 Tax=Eleginops maclovinus TaxID=56733 RepID=A0AAN8APN0_ELEMC|nr:hypothetical protein PBY51_025064 [Eleginops maclovinus]